MSPKRSALAPTPLQLCRLTGEAAREAPVVPLGEGCPGCRRVGNEGVVGKGDLDLGLLLPSCVT